MGPLHVGIGNPYRGDDGVGPWIAARLAAAGLRSEVHEGDGTGLIDLFAAADHVILIDATRSGRTPGTLTRIDGRDRPVPADLFHYSTHRFGLAEAVETARALDMLPPRLTVLGIEGAEFGSGQALSPAVARAAEALAGRLLDDGSMPAGSQPSGRSPSPPAPGSGPGS